MKSLIEILTLYVRHHPGWFIWGTVIAIVSALASITLLATAGWYLGATAVAGASGGAALLMFSTFYPGLIIRVAAFARTFGRYAERVITHDATFRSIARIRLYVYDGISRLSFRQLRDFRSGELLARLTNDIDALDGIYLRVVLPLLTAIVATLALLIVLHGVNGLMALSVAFILLSALVLLPAHAARIGVKLGRRIAFTSEALRLRYIDLLRGQVELIMAGRLGDQIGSVASAASRIRELQERLAFQDHLGRAMISLAGGLAVVIALLLAGFAYEQGEMNEAMVLLSVFAVFALTDLFAPIRRGLLEIGKVIYAGNRVLPLMSSTVIEPDDTTGDHGPVRLEMDRIDFSYSAQAAPIVEDFSLSLRSGEAIGIVGTSGAGKSTLLGLVAGLLEPDTGRVRLEYKDGRKAHLSPRIGLLTQRTELFRESLAFNLRIAHEDADEQSLEAAIELAQLGPLIDRLPEGLDQKLGDEGQGLSGGESRRLALARLILFKPDIWLLDEATEGLDSSTAKAVLVTLRQETKNKALLFVTHKKQEAALADRLLVLKEGQAPRLITRANQPDWQSILETLR